MQPENQYVMDGNALYLSLQTIPTQNTVKLIPKDQSWNMFQGSTISHDPKRDYRNFYQKYTLAYNDNDNWPYNKGIPIISSNKTADASLLSARDTVIHMLKSNDKYQHKILDAMLNAKARITIKAHDESWNLHPEVPDGIESGGGSLKEPSTGANEDALCYQGTPHYSRGRHELIEEFGHSIQEMAIISVDAELYQRIRKATKAACNRTVWEHSKAISSSNWDEKTESDEYYASGVEFLFGDNPINPFHHAKTKQELHDLDPNLYCLSIAIYGSSNTWSPSQPCNGKPVSSITATVDCNKILSELDASNPICASAMHIWPSIIITISLIILTIYTLQ